MDFFTQTYCIKNCISNHSVIYFITQLRNLNIDWGFIKKKIPLFLPFGCLVLVSSTEDIE